MWKPAVVCALVCLCGDETAESCSFALTQHETDAAEQKLDRQPPDRVEATVVRIMRGRAPGPESTSCDDIGVIEIELRRFEDDRTPRQRLGYRLALVEGTLPDGMRLPAEALRAFVTAGTPVRIPLPWLDGATDAQEPFEFSLTVTAIDLAGNGGAPSLPVRISHPGRKAPVP
jgi:hypothetical protein